MLLWEEANVRELSGTDPMKAVVRLILFYSTKTGFIKL